MNCCCISPWFAVPALIFLIGYLGLFVYGVGSVFFEDWKQSRRKK